MQFLTLFDNTFVFFFCRGPFRDFKRFWLLIDRLKQKTQMTPTDKMIFLTVYRFELAHL